jgi:hypothetical protein
MLLHAFRRLVRRAIPSPALLPLAHRLVVSTMDHVAADAQGRLHVLAEARGHG